jgi:hypothetical protein
MLRKVLSSFWKYFSSVFYATLQIWYEFLLRKNMLHG